MRRIQRLPAAFGFCLSILFFYAILLAHISDCGFCCLLNFVRFECLFFSRVCVYIFFVRLYCPHIAKGVIDQFYAIAYAARFTCIRYWDVYSERFGCKRDEEKTNQVNTLYEVVPTSQFLLSANEIGGNKMKVFFLSLSLHFMCHRRCGRRLYACMCVFVRYVAFGWLCQHLFTSSPSWSINGDNAYFRTE